MSKIARDRSLLWIIALAAAVRVLALVANVKPGYLAGLLAHQTAIADAVLQHGQWFRVLDHGHFRPEVIEMPGLALIDIGVWSIIGSHSYLPLKLAQIAIDTTMVLVVCWIALHLFRRRRVALFAAGLYAVSPAAIVLAKTPSLDTWAAFILINAVATFVWARELPGSYARLIPLGLLAGIGVYFRPTLVLVPPVLALVAYPGSWRRKAVAAAVPTFIVLLLILPWTIRNTAELHAFVPLRSGFGATLWEGLGETSNNFGAIANDGATTQQVHLVRPDLVTATGEVTDMVAYDNYLRAKAVKAITHHPTHYVRLLLRRSVFLLPCLLVLFWRRRWTQERLLLAATAVATILPYVVIHMESRYWAIAGFAYSILLVVAVECAVTR